MQLVHFFHLLKWVNIIICCFVITLTKCIIVQVSSVNFMTLWTDAAFLEWMNDHFLLCWDVFQCFSHPLDEKDPAVTPVLSLTWCSKFSWTWLFATSIATLIKRCIEHYIYRLNQTCHSSGRNWDWFWSCSFLLLSFSSLSAHQEPASCCHSRQVSTAGGFYIILLSLYSKDSMTPKQVHTLTFSLWRIFAIFCL